MNKDYTHVAMIIDRSGSMSSCWSDVKGGYKEIVKTNKNAPGKCTFTVAAFDTEYTLLEDFVDIQAVKDNLDVCPRGGTALLDAIGRTIVSVGERLKNMKKKERPAKVMVIIQTDGYENASKEFKKDDIKRMINTQTEEYNWQFQFIGASLDSVNEAQSWGIRGGCTSTYSTEKSLDTFTLLGSKMLSARSAPDMVAYAACCSFSDDDRKILNEEKEKVKTTTTNTK